MGFGYCCDEGTNKSEYSEQRRGSVVVELAISLLIKTCTTVVNGTYNICMRRSILIYRD